MAIVVWFFCQLRHLQVVKKLLLSRFLHFSYLYTVAAHLTGLGGHRLLNRT